MSRNESTTGSRLKRTPLMRQYHQVKEKYPDTILLFRLGDFYETFEEDAVTTARVCGSKVNCASASTKRPVPATTP